MRDRLRVLEDEERWYARGRRARHPRRPPALGAHRARPATGGHRHRARGGGQRAGPAPGGGGHPDRERLRRLRRLGRRGDGADADDAHHRDASSPAAGDDAPSPSDALRRRAEHRARARRTSPRSCGSSARVEAALVAYNGGPGLRPPRAAERRGAEALRRRLPARRDRASGGGCASARPRSRPGARCRAMDAPWRREHPERLLPHSDSIRQATLAPRSVASVTRWPSATHSRRRRERMLPSKRFRMDGLDIRLEESEQRPGPPPDRHARRPHRPRGDRGAPGAAAAYRSRWTSPRCAPSSTSRSMHSPGRSGTDPCPSRGSGDTRHGCSGTSGSGPTRASSPQRRERAATARLPAPT